MCVAVVMSSHAPAPDVKFHKVPGAREWKNTRHEPRAGGRSAEWMKRSRVRASEIDGTDLVVVRTFMAFVIRRRE